MPDLDANRDGTVSASELIAWLRSRYTQALGAVLVVGGVLARFGVLDAPPAPCPVVPEALEAPAPVAPTPAPEPVAPDTDTPKAPQG